MSSMQHQISGSERARRVVEWAERRRVHDEYLCCPAVVVIGGRAWVVYSSEGPTDPEIDSATRSFMRAHGYVRWLRVHRLTSRALFGAYQYANGSHTDPHALFTDLDPDAYTGARARVRRARG